MFYLTCGLCCSALGLFLIIDMLKVWVYTNYDYGDHNYCYVQSQFYW